MKAFRYISQEEEDIGLDTLKGYFEEEGIDAGTSEMILRQLAEYEVKTGRFDYKTFASNLY
jgi:hypothetical protein